MTSLQHRLYLSFQSKPEPSWVPQLRTPRATRLLVSVYFIGLTLALVAEIIGVFFWPPALIGLVVSLVAAIVAWTLLRRTIRLKDAAPLEDLDDYEREMLLRWRYRAMRYAMAVLAIGGTVTLILGGLIDATATASQVALATGLYMLYAYLFIGTLPTVGLALTFNWPLDDQN